MPPLAGLKILAAAPDFPYPPDHGGRTDVWGRLQAWRQLGATVDLVVTVKAPPRPAELAMVEAQVRRARLCSRTRRWSDHLALLPFQATSRGALARVDLDRESYDCLWMDGECVWPILANRSLRARAVVVRINNDESRYFRDLSRSTSSWPAKAYYQMESLKFARLWPRVVQAAAGRLCFASRDEWQAFTAAAPGGGTCWLPSPIGLEEMVPPHGGAPGAVLFVGSLFMPNNIQGLLWYLDRVHGLVTVPGYSLTIAGNCRGANLRTLKARLNTLGNVRLVPSPSGERLAELYREGTVFINPMRHGAGITLKTANALRAGLPVVTTATGSAGSGLRADEHLLVAESAQGFAAAVDRLLTSPALAAGLVHAAQTHLQCRFNHVENLAAYMQKTLQQAGARASA